MKKILFIIIILVIIPYRITLADQANNGYINIPSFDKIYKLNSIRWFFKAEDNINFKKMELNTNGWHFINPYFPWQMNSAEHSGYHGNAWYRLNIGINSLDPKTKYGLWLPYCYRSVQIYLNGNFIYETRNFSPTGETPLLGSKPVIANYHIICPYNLSLFNDVTKSTYFP